MAETGRYERGFQRFAQALTTAVDMAAQAYQRDGSLSGLATGLTDLDLRMGGLQPSDLIILAGRPGMGKTALATNIAYNVARAWPGEVRADGHTATVNGGIVGFFSLEMSAEQLATRIIAEQTGIPSNKIRRGAIDEGDFEKIKDISTSCRACRCTSTRRAAFPSGNLRRAPDGSSGSPGSIFWSSTTSSSCKAQPAARAKTACRKSPKSPPDSRRSPRILKIPILALSQLSRQVEQRDNKRPQLSDLRESGSIEQDADVVLFVFREAYYQALQKPEGDQELSDWSARAEELHNSAEIIIAKHRHGPTATVELNFKPDLTRFSCRERRYDLTVGPHENVYH